MSESKYSWIFDDDIYLGPKFDTESERDDNLPDGAIPVTIPRQPEGLRKIFGDLTKSPEEVAQWVINNTREDLQ